MHDYNTSREPLQLREMGRNIQKLAKFLTTVEDRETRNRYAEAMVELMKQVVPDIKHDEEYNQRLWDDLHILSDYELDIDSPYPKPDPKVLARKPDKVSYGSNGIHFRHYGKNVEHMAEEATKMEDPEKKENAVIHLGRLLKSFHITWNKETPDDEVILGIIQKLSGGKLTIELEKVKEENLFDPLYQERSGGHNRRMSNHRNKKKGGPKNQNRRRRN